MKNKSESDYNCVILLNKPNLGSSRLIKKIKMVEMGFSYGCLQCCQWNMPVFGNRHSSLSRTI